MELDAPEAVTPWANGPADVIPVPPCRRTAVRALGGWTYCDHQRPTFWPEHHHAGHVQLLIGFDRADCIVRWRNPGRRSVSEKPIRANQVWILPQGISHEVEWRREADLVMLHIEPRRAYECAGQPITDVSLEPLAPYVQAAPVIGELCGLLRRAGLTRGALNEPLVSGLGAALATQLIASHFRRTHAHHPQHLLLPRPILADMCAYIDAHLSEKLTLPALARAAALSPNYFGQMFRAALGISPIGYVIEQRVLRAREMLRRGDATVAEVAHAVGFSDQHQMNRHFKRLLHTPPSAYRPTKERG